MSLSRILGVIAVSLAVASCAHTGNLPINEPLTDAGVARNATGVVGTEGRAMAEIESDLIVGLAFSGGGTRAAAFSFGALKGLERTQVSGRGRKIDPINQVNFVSGVSGGSVTAAYFGLKKRAALIDFRERFLIKDAEEALNTRVSLANLSLGLGGGINEDTRLRGWLDANLFEGATFSNLAQRPFVWLNATDIYNRTPFIFIPLQFSLICSDLGAYPISAAVAASAAVPLVFSPIILEPYPNRCNAKMPTWLLRAQNDPNASPLLRGFAQGIQNQTNGSMKYIKLLDGGLVDNYGLSGFTIAREASQTPYGPLTPREAVKLRRLLFLVVDSGAEPQQDWAQTLEGPSGAKLIGAITDVTLDSAKIGSYSAFDATMRIWREALVRWRCGLPKAEVVKLIGTGAWNCRDLQFFIGRLTFDQLEKERADILNKIPTRFKLPVESVDELIAAGSDALLRNPSYRKFLGSL